MSDNHMTCELAKCREAISGIYKKLVEAVDAMLEEKIRINKKIDIVKR